MENDLVFLNGARLVEERPKLTLLQDLSHGYMEALMVAEWSSAA